VLRALVKEISVSGASDKPLASAAPASSQGAAEELGRGAKPGGAR